METPIFDFVKNYADGSPCRLHMPGHKGNGALGIEKLDITEIGGADVLYSPDGIIQRSQANSAALFGTQATLYSAEGSSLAIRAMLCLTKLYGGESCTVLAARNAHKVFITAAALLGIRVNWLYPSEGSSVLACPITPQELEQALAKAEQPPTAVYITSPDYLGNIADIQGLAQVAHRYGSLLITDNAHGAYLRFLPQSKHPIDLGADCCCDSAHKTLPVLTGGAYLHIAHSAPAVFTENAHRAMAMFASTSPSYLILQSLDLANRFMAEELPHKLGEALPIWSELRTQLTAQGFTLAGDEPLKLTVLPKSYGYSGEELAKTLERSGIIAEFADRDNLVLMLPLDEAEQTAKKLSEAFLNIPRKSPIKDAPPQTQRLICKVSPSKAIYMPSREIKAEESLGRIMADACVSCPPAVPFVSIGELIDESAIRALEYYGIKRIRVLCD